MGVKEMALGLATLDLSTGKMEYYNLWLPSRFSMLFLYLITVIICFILLVADARRRRRGGGDRSRRRSGSRQVMPF